MAKITNKQLSYFVAAAETKSIAEAAVQKNISQPSISSALIKMESILGVTLFIRHHAQGVSLTPTGTRLLPHAREVLRGLNEFEGLARSQAEDPIGDLLIGCYPTLAPIFMPTLISHFHENYPKVSIRFIEGAEDELLPKLESGEIDAGILYDISLPENVKHLKLKICKPYVLLCEKHPLAKRKEMELSEIADEPFILLNTRSGREYFPKLFKDAGIEPKPYYKSTSFEVIRGMVARGIGFSVLITRPVSKMTYDGLNLAHVPIREPVTGTSICLVRMPVTTTTKIVEILKYACLNVAKKL